MFAQVRIAALLLALSIFLPGVEARQGVAPLSRRNAQMKPLRGVPSLVVAPTDVAAELAADAQRLSVPLRIASPVAVRVTPKSHGVWEDVAGGRAWRLRVHSAGATDLNLGFSECELPEGATLHVISEAEDYVQGPYVARDNKPHGQLWTPALPGDKAVIELFVPNGAVEPRLLLSRVNCGYRDLFRRGKGAGSAKSGSCNIDVMCPAAAPWTNEVRSVARYVVDGITLCSGSLVNNAVGDYRPFFLTANHCGITPANAATVVVYWNFQSPNCGQHGGGSLAQNQSGAIFRAARSDTDMTLIELEEMPEPSVNAFYSGLDRSTNQPPGAVGIHHPGGSEKAISFSSNALTTVNNCLGGGSSTHWNVQWSLGVTEPGSSGSGIWNPTNHLLVGTLSGGYSSCAQPTLADCYGKLSMAWTNGTSSAQRIGDWLDPLGTGIETLAGVNSRSTPLIRAGVLTIAAESLLPTNGMADPGEIVTVALPLRNVGLTNTTNLVATLLATNGVTAPGAAQNYGVLPTNGPDVSRNFLFIVSAICGGRVAPTFVLSEGTNCLGVLQFTIEVGRPANVFTQNFDSIAVPALPGGWTSSSSGAVPGWFTTATYSESSPNSVYAPTTDDGAAESALTSPVIAIATSNATVSFRHRFDLELGWDGGVLEVSTNGNSFNDVLAAGCTFELGGYTGGLDASMNPLAARSAWTGGSGGFVTTQVRMPTSYAGASVQLRWRLGNDESVSYDGWYVDSVFVTDGANCWTPELFGARREGSNFVFSFSGAVGIRSFTEAKSTLESNSWAAIQTNMGVGETISVTNSASGARRFFRVRME